MQIRLNHTAARARGRSLRGGGGKQIIPSLPSHLSIVSCGNREADFNLFQLLPGFRKYCACQSTLLKRSPYSVTPWILKISRVYSLKQILQATRSFFFPSPPKKLSLLNGWCHHILQAFFILGMKLLVISHIPFVLISRLMISWQHSNAKTRGGGW